MLALKRMGTMGLMIHHKPKVVYSTFNPISAEKEILEKLSRVATDLEEDLERTGWAGKTITLKYKLDTYQGVFPPSLAPCFLDNSIS